VPVLICLPVIDNESDRKEALRSYACNSSRIQSAKFCRKNSIYWEGISTKSSRYRVRLLSSLMGQCGATMSVGHKDLS